MDRHMIARCARRMNLPKAKLMSLACCFTFTQWSQALHSSTTVTKLAARLALLCAKCWRPNHCGPSAQAAYSKHDNVTFKQPALQGRKSMSDGGPKTRTGDQRNLPETPSACAPLERCLEPAVCPSPSLSCRSRPGLGDDFAGNTGHRQQRIRLLEYAARPLTKMLPAAFGSDPCPASQVGQAPALAQG